MLAGTADKPKKICVNHHVANLGRKKSEAVLGLHAFTGGDWGGKFSGVTKERLTQRFLELDEGLDVITALQKLGTDPQSNMSALLMIKAENVHLLTSYVGSPTVPRALRERTFHQQEVPSFNISVERGWLR